MTYRGEIHESDTVNVFDLITHNIIEDWIAEGVSILVQRVFIEVDSSCRVAIESFNEEEPCLTQSIASSAMEIPPLAANSVSVYIGGAAAGGACGI